MIVREGFLHTFITGNLKYEKTPDKIYSEQPEVNDVIKGPVIGAGNLVEAERLTWTGHPIKGTLKRLEGIGNIYGMYTLGLGSFLGDFADRYTPGELQYGTSEEVGRRQKTENLAVKLSTDILVSRAFNGLVSKKV